MTDRTTSVVIDPKVYTLPAGSSFVDQLVDGIFERGGDDPLSLSRTIVFLPNRRAVRSLREAFLRRSAGKPLLLPQLRAIGDTDTDEIEFLAAGSGIAVHDIVPPINKMQRQAYLMKLVQQWWLSEKQSEPMAPAQAWRFAGELARLLDQVGTEDLSFDHLADIVPDSLAVHWQQTLEFLKIVSLTWPQILAEQNVQDPATYRNQTLYILTETMRLRQPDTPVIAAGSTGTIPATAALLSVIARLPQGAVVLPAFDTEMDDTLWDAISDTHPQAAMKRLLTGMGVSRHEVEPWVISGQAGGPAHTTRLQLIRDSLLPASLTGRWQQADWSKRLAATDANLFNGFHSVTAPGRREEAEAIALAMRGALEVPGRTAALVTPDRQLALYVRASLQRWDIDVDDSGGDKAVNSLPGRLLALIASAVSDRFAPLPLLSLLQHPLVAAGRSRAEFLSFLRKLDHLVLRGVRPAGGLQGLRARAESLLQTHPKLWLPNDQAVLGEVLDIMLPFEKLLENAHPLTAVLTLHIEIAEALVRTLETAGADILWQGEAGHALAKHLGDILENTSLLEVPGASGYATFFVELMQGAVVRPSWNKHPRLAIWGPLEARLQQADLMIIGGLNEGVWPSETAADPWMNNDMRTQFGLPSHDRRIGQAAHDFLLAVSGPDVLLTRAEKTDGTPTIPSRWLLRLEALLGGPLPQASQYLTWASQLSDSTTFSPVMPPAPRPKLAARPRKLSVTQVQEWMRDPYALYAKKILGFSVRDPIDDKPNAATKGIILHEALEAFLKEDGPRFGEAGLARLMQIGERLFEPVRTQPAVHAFWWPRFERIAQWFVAHEEGRSEQYDIALIEGTGRYAFTTQNGLTFTLEARADRIDQNRETGALDIIDYKTGTVPTGRQLKAGYAPQLPLEGLLANLGAFEGLDPAAVEALTFWKITGGNPVHEIKRPIKDIDGSIEEATEGLKKLLHTFDDDRTPYLSNPRPDTAGYGDYDHLARFKEWQGLSAADTPQKSGKENTDDRS